MITFRLLMPTDLPLLHHWLNAPHLRDGWFGSSGYPAVGYSIADTERDFGEWSRHLGPVRAFIARVDGTDVAYIQTYRIEDLLTYAGDFADDVDHARRSSSLDVFIGDPAYVGRGLGPKVVRTFVVQQVFTDDRQHSVLINPEPTNQPAIRSYEKAGFRFVKTLDAVPGRKASYVMRMDRQDVPTASSGVGTCERLR